MFVSKRRMLASMLIGGSIILTIYTVFLKRPEVFQSQKDHPSEGNPSDYDPLEKVNTSGHSQNGKKQACVHPKLELWHPALKRYFQVNEPPLQCAADKNWVYCEDGKFVISDTAIKKHGKIRCDYQPHFRANDDFAMTSGKTIKEMKSRTNLLSDFFNVNCTAADGMRYDNIQSSISFDEKIHKRLEKSTMPRNAMGLNVLMYGLDSMSRMTYMRNLPKTHDYFTKELGGVVLEGYNIVGDGTPQALLPILCGQTELELPEARRGHKGAKPVDGHPWIWKDFAKAGYATQYNEDATSLGAFTYRMLGFKVQPTDHYMRSFYRKAEHQYRKHKPHCLGSIPRYLNVMNYIKDFLKMYKGKPRFTFSFMSELTHDSNTKVKVADDGHVQFLKALKDGNYLNTTIVILMADHGARFQAVRQVIQGKYEERMPYFGILLPPWFKTKYPVAYKNLHINARRLTSPFDIHATFLHLLNYTGSEIGSLKKRSISLFDEVPLERTCKHTDIENHWCACLNWKKVSITDSKVKNAAEALLSTINKLTEPERSLCEKLKIKEIKIANKFVPKPNMVKFKKAKDNDGFVPDLTDNMKVDEVFYQVTVLTSPNDGLYEATVKLSDKSSYVAQNDISRINMYGNQPHCISSRLPYLRKFCYCKKKLP